MRRSRRGLVESNPSNASLNVLAIDPIKSKADEKKSVSTSPSASYWLVFAITVSSFCSLLLCPYKKQEICEGKGKGEEEEGRREENAGGKGKVGEGGGGG